MGRCRGLRGKLGPFNNVGSHIENDADLAVLQDQGEHTLLAVFRKITVAIFNRLMCLEQPPVQVLYPFASVVTAHELGDICLQSLPEQFYLRNQRTDLANFAYIVLEI